MKITRKLLAWILLLSLILSNVTTIPVQAEDTNEVVINALDYGADPTGAEDSTQAVWNALQAAKAAETNGKHVTLEFPKGEYHIYKDRAQTREYHTSNTNSIENPVKTIGILIEEHENLTVDGNGSLFMMHGNMMALAVVESENIVLREFSWDFAVPTVVEMTVTGVGSNYTDYYIPECFPHTVSGNTIRWSSDLSPYTGQAYWSGSGHEPDGRSTYAVVGYHPDDEMARNYYPSDGPLSNVRSITELDENSVRVYYSNRSGTQSQNQKVGTIFELCGNAHRETAGAFTWESENVTVEEVNVHFMHGFGWLIQMSKDVYYKRCNLVPRENSGHTTVSFADGIHASGAAGELVFEDCNFANTHDDPLNLHGTFTRVESRNNNNTLTLKYIHGQQGGFPQYHVGDKVQFFTRDTLESTDGEKMYTVAEIIQDTDESTDKKTMIIRFEETLPTNLSDKISGQPKYVAENVTYAPAVTIRNCTFRNVATRGVLCTTRNKVLIENNAFYNMSMATIYLSNDSDEWYESGPIRDMTIRNNVFYIKDIGRTAWNTAPAIYVHPVTKGGGLPDASNPIHKNITIEGNTFYMDLDRVVEAESVENLTFRNNKVYRMNPDVKIDIALADTAIAAGETTALTVNASGNTNAGSIDNLFQFKSCKNVVIEGNTYDDGLKRCAVVDQATINNGITVNDEEISVVTSATSVSAPVTDIKYATTDASVASVDANGNITGVANGTATIFAYYEWNDTMVRSNYVEVTVEGVGESEVAEGIEIVRADGSAADNTEVDLKSVTSIRFAEKDDKEVTWSVVDFETGAATNKATIAADGTLTAMQEGIIWVKAVSAEGAEDKVAVVIYGADSYGLNPNISIVREDSAKYRYDADSVTLDMQSGDLWETGSWTNNLKNIFLYTPNSDISRSNLRTVVKVTGLPARVASNNWDTASFILYKDDDNYVSVGKKAHKDGFTYVTESNGTGTEVAEGSTANNNATTAYMGMTVTSAGISLDYKLEGQSAWSNLGTVSNVGIIGDSYKIGFGIWGNEGKSITFSEFKVGSADLSYDELPAVSIEKVVNTRPEVTNVSVAIEGITAKATYTYTDADKDAQGTTLFRWTYEKDGEEATTVTASNSFSVVDADEVACQVYPVDEYGTPGTPSEVKTTSFESEDTTELYSVAFNGEVVFERNDEKEVIVKIPEELEKVEMAYVSVNNNVGDVSISKNGAVLEGAYENSDSIILDVADGDVIVIVRDEVVYTFIIEMIASNITMVRRIAIDALGFEELPTEDVKAYYLNASSTKGSGMIDVTVNKAVGNLEILKGDLREPLEVIKSGNTYSAEYTLVEGLNSFYVKSKAADGITEKQYIVNITYSPLGELSSIESEKDAADDSNDLVASKITYSAGSEVEAGNASATEGGIRLAFDNNINTYWHSEWNPTWNVSQHENYLWVQFDLAEATVVDAIRYLPRPNGSRNGDITGYRVEGTVDGTTWTTLTEGAWTSTGQEWKVAEFEARELVGLRLVATSTTADSAQNKFASAAELRVRTYASPTDKSALLEAIAEVKALEAEDYTANSWEALVEALEEAKIINADSKATQEQVNEVLADLQAAQDALEAKPVDPQPPVDPVEPVNPFEDVYDTDYYYDPVMWAVENGITDGWTPTLFAPEMGCTRGQVVTFLWRAAGEPKAENAENPFTDVAENAYYYDAVLWAVENGITDGWTATTFAPDMTCTRGQIVTFIWRAAGEPEVTAENPFTDVAENAYYYDAVLWAVENGITDGWMPTEFAPEMDCTRGQIVTFLYRYYNPAE